MSPAGGTCVCRVAHGKGRTRLGRPESPLSGAFPGWCGPRPRLAGAYQGLGQGLPELLGDSVATQAGQEVPSLHETAQRCLSFLRAVLLRSSWWISLGLLL